MKQSEAHVATEHASSYLKKLCNHWSHKFPVTFNDTDGRIELNSTVCTLYAEPAALAVRLELPDDEDQARIEQVLEKHLQRFGFKEELIFPWVRT